MQDFRDVCRTIAREAGLKFISKGWYSRVYGNADTVVKIINNVASQQDTLAFLRYAKKHCDSNPFLPRVFSITVDGRYAIVAMEKLSNARWRVREAKLEKLIGYGFGEIYDRRDLQEATKLAKDENLRNVLKYLHGRARRKFAELDLHQQNYLWRGEQIVITDPFAS